MSTWNNLYGQDLTNCVTDRCGKQPILSDPKYTISVNAGIGTSTQQNEQLYRNDSFEYQKCVAKEQPYCIQLKKLTDPTINKPYVATASTAVNIALNSASTNNGGIATKEDEVIMDTRPQVATPKGLPMPVKIGLGVAGLLVLGFIGYKMFGKKAS